MRFLLGVFCGMVLGGGAWAFDDFTADLRGRQAFDQFGQALQQQRILSGQDPVDGRPSDYYRNPCR